MRPFTIVFLLALAFAPSALARGAELSVSASAPGVVAIGDELTATAIVRNQGPATATAVKLTDALKGPFALVSAVPTRGSCTAAGGVVTCSLGSLRKGASVEIDVTLEALAAGDVRNAFSVRGRRSDPRRGNNAASTLTSVPRPTCTITGTAGKDRLVGSSADDVVCGLGGNDVLRGLDGDDTLYGGSGNDRLVGGAGDDRLGGEEGSDTADFKGAPRSVRANLRRGIASGDGADQLGDVERVLGSRYADVLRGSAAKNRLAGGAGADKLYGGRGRDKLYGRGGNDRLDGGRGRDALYGGRGRDRCLSGRRISC